MTQSREGSASAANGRPPRMVFASDKLPPELDNATRYALWCDLHEEHFGSTDLYFLADRGFSVRVEFAQFGAVGVARLEGTMRRSRARHAMWPPTRATCCVWRSIAAHRRSPAFSAAATSASPPAGPHW
jgi:hypothetical protein